MIAVSLVSLGLGMGVSVWMTRGSAPSNPSTQGKSATPGSTSPVENPLAGGFGEWQAGSPVAIGAEPIVARPAGSDVPYVVVVRVAVVGQPDDSRWEQKVNSRLERLRDAVTSELMETPIGEMQLSSYKASLSSQLKVRFAKIPGMESVQEVLIPMFAVQ